MKINPYSSSYTSSAAKRHDSRGQDKAVARGDGTTPYGQKGVNKSSSKNESFLVDSNTKRATSVDGSTSRKRNAALEYRSQQNEVENRAAKSTAINYYSATANAAAAFYVPEANTSAGFGTEPLNGNFQRLNNQLTAHALQTYRTHQEMDDEQALRQAHQIALGVDTYA